MTILDALLELRTKLGLWIGVVAITVLAGCNALAGSTVVLAGLMPIGPCLTATFGGRRSVLAVGGYSVLLILLLSPIDHFWWTRTLFFLLIAACAITALCLLIAARRAAADASLRRLASQRRDLLVRLVTAHAAERARIAADIHDDSVQALAAADLRLGLLRRKLQQGPAELYDQVDQLQASLTGATSSLRELMFDLEPPGEDVSLLDGLRDIGAYIFENEAVAFAIEGDFRIDLAYPERVNAIRIAKEALGNVRDHACASRVTVSVSTMAEGVEIAVSDDGIGPHTREATSSPERLELMTMRDQAEVAGGWFRVEGAPAAGTTIRFWIPGLIRADGGR